MEMHLDALGADARASASVVLLRDGPHGLEVFLVRRHGESDVLGGAYVFPGGKVDAQDASPGTLRAVGEQPAAMHRALGEADLGEREAAALFAAAVRETMEETGVRLAAADLHPWSRWITPVVGGVIRKRFDTRFFLAAMPAGQEATHDGHEAVESAWLAPREALARYWARELVLAPPQIMSLAHLAMHRDVGAALAQARACVPPRVLPEPFEHEGGRVICYPGDERHSVRERALPGPTRLYFRQGRFEPEHGFDAFFPR